MYKIIITDLNDNETIYNDVDNYDDLYKAFFTLSFIEDSKTIYINFNNIKTIKIYEYED